MVTARRQHIETLSPVLDGSGGGSRCDEGVAATKTRGMARIAAEQYALAEAVNIPGATLAEWYQRQLSDQRGYVNRLEKALKAAQADPRLEDRASPMWKTYWTLDARYRYAFETLGLLAKREHVLVCPVDGIAGVDLPEEWRVGLSLRGLLTGEDATTWERYCEGHSGTIELTAKKLHAEWDRG